MIRYAPIWLNEWLVNIIKLLVYCAFVVFVVMAIWFLYKLIIFMIEMRKEKKILIEFFKEKKIIFILCGFLLASFVLVLFYMPQQVLPSNYSFDKISMRMVSPSSTERIEITNREALEEFSNSFSGYICRRSVSSSSQTIFDSEAEVIFFDITVRLEEKDRAFPLHFIVKKDNLRRYTAGNTSFIYRINDEEHHLENKLFDYAKRHFQK